MDHFFKNEWMSMCCSTDTDKAAIKSWFAPLLPEAFGNPLRAQILQDPDTGKTKKVRALFSVDGRMKMGVISIGSKARSVSFQNANAGILKGYKPEGAA